ncbi:YlcG family protein, partial [Klebsiella variicola]
MSRDVIERIRDRWIKLRLLRSSGTVLVDYPSSRISFASIRPWERQHESRIYR